MSYRIISTIDYEEIASGIKTLQEAKKRVKQLEQFDKEQGNPFKEGYCIEVE